MPNLRILTYNIHKLQKLAGIEELKNFRQELGKSRADILCLQEVQGRFNMASYKKSRQRISQQHHLIGDRDWPYRIYDGNAFYRQGDHGNAILSNYPIFQWQWESLIFAKAASRSLLHGVVQVGESRIHCLCVHLGLFPLENALQRKLLGRYIDRQIPADAAVLVCGDFNDWMGRVRMEPFASRNFFEAHFTIQKILGKTFPAYRPRLALDRIYIRHATVKSAQVLRSEALSRLSDHLPILAEISF